MKTVIKPSPEMLTILSHVCPLLEEWKVSKRVNWISVKQRQAGVVGSSLSRLGSGLILAWVTSGFDIGNECLLEAAEAFIRDH